MSAEFSIVPIQQLAKLIEFELNQKNSIFGIPQSLFFKPDAKDSFRMHRYGQLLETPLGVAAGPHTQLAQNIVCAWLCGARYIELKTVQTLDELTISKPCIDMQDEGYNCEWSQELKLEVSHREYLKAWILIHWLQIKLNHPNNGDRGFIFNMSVGYNMEGILKENVQQFLMKMEDSSLELVEELNNISTVVPEIFSIPISSCLSDNITLSTMHGCPPHEIQSIAEYLLLEKKYHTTIKLNPTLLGSEMLREILNNRMRFPTNVPDEAFEHDLKYDDALKMISHLQSIAKMAGVEFNIKLTNTLEAINHKNIFPTQERMMYMSGRALHPLGINVARKLQNDFEGSLDLSFSGGIDAFNAEQTLKCGLAPLTICSDLLKPGGYGRLAQYIENIQNWVPGKNNLEQLNVYADTVIHSEYYQFDPFEKKEIKNSLPLNKFDCIKAPCTIACATNQDIPNYLWHASQGEFGQSHATILAKNPFPYSLGLVCDHKCQSSCTRIHYDESLKIKDVKHFVASIQTDDLPIVPENLKSTSVGIIGGGPAGLSAAYFLRLAGFQVNLYESSENLGGMVNSVIPKFRLNPAALKSDIERIFELKPQVYFNHRVDSASFQKIRKENSYIFIATGAPIFLNLGIPGEDCEGSLNAYDFLSSAKTKQVKLDYKHIAVIGGGNTAADVARTARRLLNNEAKVSVIYRRSILEMPADGEEIKSMLAEGIEIIEYTAPEEILNFNEKVNGVRCYKTRPGEKNAQGKSSPEKIPNSSFIFSCDCVISAIGQNNSIDFWDENSVSFNPKTLETSISNVFIGGDARSGASTFIKAVGDGRRVAKQIINKEKSNFDFSVKAKKIDWTYNEFIEKKSKRKFSVLPQSIPNFSMEPTHSPIKTSREEIQVEAERCFQCDQVCSICVTVCPNRANRTIEIDPLIIAPFTIHFAENNFKIDCNVEFRVSQRFQVVNISEFCNECGNCTTFCPTSGSPFTEKARLCLSKESFKIEKDVYYFSMDDNALLYHTSNGLHTLSEDNNNWHYNSPDVNCVISKTELKLINAQSISDVQCPDLKPLWEMMVLFRPLKNDFSWS